MPMKSISSRTICPDNFALIGLSRRTQCPGQMPIMTATTSRSAAVTAHHFIERSENAANPAGLTFEPIRLVRAIRTASTPEIRQLETITQHLALRHAITFRHQFEMVDPEEFPCRPSFLSRRWRTARSTRSSIITSPG